MYSYTLRVEHMYIDVVLYPSGSGTVGDSTVGLSYNGTTAQDCMNVDLLCIVDTVLDID